MSIEKIRAEWNTDAFLINDSLLIKKCKEWAGQQVALAKELGQSWDVTPDKLFALYKRQRGRCEESGVPMTYTPGERTPTSINLDHIVEVLRGQSRLSRCEGGSAVGGQAAMMNNIRFVCQHVHYLKKRIHEAGGELDDLLARLAVRFLHGPPCNHSIEMHNLEEIAFGTTHARSILEEWSKGWKTRPTARDLLARLKSTGIETDAHFVVTFLRDKFGCDSRSNHQRHRVEVAAAFLMNSPQVLGLMRQGSRFYFSEARQGLLDDMMSAGCVEVTDYAMREDIVIAFELVTGKKAPCLDQKNSRSGDYVRSKLDSWSKPTPVMRKVIFEIVHESGDGGVSFELIVDRVMAVQVIGGVDEHGIFRSRIAASVNDICCDLVARRLVDRCGDVLVARLSISEAAKRCGYTQKYLEKCHKIGIGPDCEYSRPGKGRSLTFSRRAIEDWVISRKSISRVRGGGGEVQRQSLLCVMDPQG